MTTSNTLGPIVIHGLNHALHHRIAGGRRNGAGQHVGKTAGDVDADGCWLEDVEVREIETVTPSTTTTSRSNEDVDRQVVISVLLGW